MDKPVPGRPDNRGQPTYPFAGLVSFLRAPVCTDLDDLDADVAIMGVPTDEGSPYMPGARFGPRGIREHSLRFGRTGYYDQDADRTFLEYELTNGRLVDVGDADVLPTNVEGTFENVTSLTRSLLDRGALPVVLGGDHAITFPVVRAYSEPLYVVHFDAHIDYSPFVHGFEFTNSHAFRHIYHMPHVQGIIQVGIRSLRNNRAWVEDSINDGNGHGTHTAGTAVADGGDGTGIFGVAPEAGLYSVKVCGNFCSTDDIAAAIDFLGDKVQIITMSIGGDTQSGLIRDAIDRNPNVLYVAAAGNDGPGGGTIDYPGANPDVIAVAAIDSTKTVASFSSRGIDDGIDAVISEKEVELSAAGVSVESTWNDGGYNSISGTSMATPHIAGLAAREWQGTAAATRAYLRTLVEDITLANGGGAGTGYDIASGYGLGHVTPAGPVNDPPSVSITTPADGSSFASGATILFEGTASDTIDGNLTANLVWTSDIGGQIGTGGSFSAILGDGNHTITASVTDSGGKTGSASISITVGTPPAVATTVSVDAVTYATEGGKNGDKHLFITVSLVDDLGSVVSGASVSIDLFRDGSPSGSGSGVTGTSGTATFNLKNAKSGLYTTGVTNVTAAGLTWNGITPPNEFPK